MYLIGKHLEKTDVSYKDKLTQSQKLCLENVLRGPDIYHEDESKSDEKIDYSTTCVRRSSKQEKNQSSMDKGYYCQSIRKTPWLWPLGQSHTTLEDNGRDAIN